MSKLDDYKEKVLIKLTRLDLSIKTLLPSLVFSFFSVSNKKTVSLNSLHLWKFNVFFAVLFMPKYTEFALTSVMFCIKFAVLSAPFEPSPDK